MKLHMKKEAIRHYNKMIKWVEKQDADLLQDIWEMSQDIKTHWRAKDCSYCKNFLLKNNDCIGCPLTTGKQFQDGGENCCKGLWIEMACSDTWGHWLKYARKIRQYIIDNG